MADYILTHSGAQVDSAVGRAIAGGQIDTALTAHTSNTTIHVTSADKTAWNGKASKSAVLTGTLTVAGWSNQAQTLTIAGMPVSGYAYTVAPSSADIEDYIGSKIYADDVTVANNITFHCDTVPTNPIDVVILKIEVA